MYSFGIPYGSFKFQMSIQVNVTNVEKMSSSSNRSNYCNECLQKTQYHTPKNTLLQLCLAMTCLNIVLLSLLYVL